MKLHFFYERDLTEVQTVPFQPKDGIDHWVLTTYYILREKLPYFSFSIGKQIPVEGVIFFHKRSFPKESIPTKKQFFVCFQVDYGRHQHAQWHIVHNPYQGSALYFPKLFIDSLFSFSNTKYVNPWPQSGIIKRNRKRPRTVENISYHGSLNNLCEEIKTDEFQNFLESLNLKLLLKGEPCSWSDFSDTDLVLTMRSWNRKPYYSKPYLKISNALLANVPVVGGGDSSSKYFNKRFVDIPLVQNVEELKQLLLQIKNKTYDPFFQVDKFEKISDTFNEAGVVNTWILMLEKIEIDFTKWKNSPGYKKKLFRMVRSFLN